MKAIVFGSALLALASTPLCAQISDDVVKIGVLTDMAGVTADITGKGSVIAAELAVKEFGGSVLGKPIQVVFADHQHKPDLGTTIARRWIDVDKVDALVDIPNSRWRWPSSRWRARRRR
jgi:branched-chain amino acid transport system substrate-binding protein